MTAPHIMCIRLLTQLPWIVNPLCRSGTISSRLYCNSRNKHAAASWWSQGWSLQCANKTKLSPLLGILSISFCLLRQPIIFHAALPEARTTSCWDGFFEFHCRSIHPSIHQMKIATNKRRIRRYMCISMLKCWI
jgi:hypothetical protein